MFDNKKIVYGVGGLLVIGILVALSLVFYHVGKNKGTDDCVSSGSSGSVLVDDASGLNASEPVDILFSPNNQTGLNGATMLKPTTLKCIVSRLNGKHYLSAVSVVREAIPTDYFADAKMAETGSAPDLANAFAFEKLVADKPITTLIGTSSRLGQIVKNLGKTSMSFVTKAVVNYCGLIDPPADVTIDNTGKVTVSTAGGPAFYAYGITQPIFQAYNAFASNLCGGQGNTQHPNMQFPGFWRFSSQLL